MKTFLVIIVHFVVTAHMLSVSYGNNDCDCSCDLINYGVEDLCTSLKRATIKADNNEAAVRDLIDTKNKKILPFIERHGSSDHKKIIKNLTKEFESKQQEFERKQQEFDGKQQEFESKQQESESKQQELESKQQELERKIERLEKYCLETREELLKNIEARALKVEDELLGKISVVENRTLEVKMELSEEISKEKKHNLETKNEMLGKISQVKNFGLKLESEMSGRVTEIRNQILNLNSSVLPRLKAVEIQTSDMEHDFSAKISDIRNGILKVEEEVLEKVNVTAHRTSELKDEFFKGLNVAEENASKKIRELEMQVEKKDSDLEEKLQAEQAHRSHLAKMLNETRDKLRNVDVSQSEINITLRGEINATVEDLKEHVHRLKQFEVYRRINGLEAEGDRRNKTLEYLQAAMENYTQIENRVSLYKEIFGVLFDTFQAMDRQVLPTTQELEVKSAHLEEVFRHLLCENVSTANDVVSSAMSTAESDQQDILSITTESVTSIESEVKQCPFGYESFNFSDTSTCDTPPNYSGVNSIPFYKGPLTVENCGNTLLLDRKTKESNNITERCKANPFQFLVLVQIQHEKYFRNFGWGVVLNDKWVAAAYFHRVLLPTTKFRVLGETAATGKYQIEVDDFYQKPETGRLLLLHLRTSVPFSTSVNFSPPCLLGGSAEGKLFGPAYMLGRDLYSTDGDFSRSPLHIGKVCSIDPAECKREYPYYNLRSATFCGKLDGGTPGLCEDHGVRYLFKEIEGKEVLIGLTPFCLRYKPIFFYEYYGHIESLHDTLNMYS